MSAPNHELPLIAGRPYFHYAAGELMVEGIRLADLAQSYGTPLFVYSQSAMLAALASYEQAFAGRRALVCYAVKANPSLAVLQTFVRAGCGLDIVSGGELERALLAGVDPAKIVFSGVGKTRSEMQQALAADIACFNIESQAEMALLNQIAQGLGKRARISLRINPDVDARTHPYISTGLKGNKFGIAHAQALAAFAQAAQMPGLHLVGIACHIGSQITETAPYLDAMDRILDLVDAVQAQGIALEHIDFGGGLGIDYHGQTPPSAHALWVELLQKVDARGYCDRRLIIEPGRSLIGNAGVCVTQTLYLKEGEQKNFLIVDAAMNDLPRPAMYDAYHAIVPVRPRAGDACLVDVVGPVCESGDWLGRERHLNVQAGDLLAVCSAGAYCMSMASNYNSRGRAAEVLVRGQESWLIRARETTEDQLRAERPLR